MTNALLLALVALALLVIACLLAWSAPSLRRDVATWTSAHSVGWETVRAEEGVEFPMIPVRVSYDEGPVLSPVLPHPTLPIEPEPIKPSREGVRQAIAAGIGAHAWAGSNLAGVDGCSCGWKGCEHDDHLAEAVADAVLALFAAQPTVREVWRAAWESCCLRGGVGRDEALSDYRSEADHG